MSALGQESRMVVHVLPRPLLAVLGFKHVRARLEFWQDRPQGYLGSNVSLGSTHALSQEHCLSHQKDM